MELKQILANYVEKAMNKQIEAKMQVNIPEEAEMSDRNKLVAIGMIRMLHDSCIKMGEACVENYTPFTCRGFVEGLKEPQISEQIDECLAEIAAENDLVQHFQSPYSRLLMCYVTVGLKVVRKKPSGNTNQHDRLPRNVEPARHPPKKQLYNEPSRKQTNG